jgi:hypothetical protein
MEQDQLVVVDKDILKIEKWFLETYGEMDKSVQEMQLLILYKLHQLEERVQVIEEQTKTHWV